MDLSIIIVNYNGLDFLQKCISSVSEYLQGPHAGKKIEFEIIVVDNASTDGSTGFLHDMQKSLDFLKLIESRENCGFSKASNIGAGKASGRFLLFLNPDTEFCHGGFDSILAFYKEKTGTEKVGAIGARILNKDGSTQLSCRSFPTLARQFYESWFLSKAFAKSKVFGSYFMTYWDHKTTRKVDWLSGAFLLIKTETFYDAGCFDEKYFIYSEDADICLKLARSGYVNYYFSNYTIKHLDAGIAGRDMGRREAQIWKSRKIYFSQNYSRLHSIIASFLYFTYVINRILAASVLYALSPGIKKRSLSKNRISACRKALVIYFRGV